MDRLFTTLADRDVATAYSVIVDRFEFLRDRGIDQYPYPYPPRDAYKRDQSARRNYALYEGAQILGIVTLQTDETTADWSELSLPDLYLWVTALYTPVARRGHGLGYAVLDAVLCHARKRSVPALLLDCYTHGGLVEYYRRYGFRRLGEKRFAFAGRSFSSTLMQFDVDG